MTIIWLQPIRNCVRSLVLRGLKICYIQFRYLHMKNVSVFWPSNTELSSVKRRQQDFNQLFDCLREAHKPWYESKEVWDFQHPALIPRLRPYQSQAVKWMTEKENYWIERETPKDNSDGEQQGNLV